MEEDDVEEVARGEAQGKPRVKFTQVADMVAWLKAEQFGAINQDRPFTSPRCPGLKGCQAMHRDWAFDPIPWPRRSKTRAAVYETEAAPTSKMFG